jgi:hypothetical protein
VTKFLYEKNVNLSLQEKYSSFGNMQDSCVSFQTLTMWFRINGQRIIFEVNYKCYMFQDVFRLQSLQKDFANFLYHQMQTSCVLGDVFRCTKSFCIKMGVLARDPMHILLVLGVLAPNCKNFFFEESIGELCFIVLENDKFPYKSLLET